MLNSSMDLDKPWIACTKYGSFTLSGQSMDCLLNPRIEHAHCTGLGQSISGSMDCPHIQGLRVGQSTDCPKYGLSSHDYTIIIP